jgi:hypothetical protein
VTVPRTTLAWLVADHARSGPFRPRRASCTSGKEAARPFAADPVVCGAGVGLLLPRHDEVTSTNLAGRVECRRGQPQEFCCTETAEASRQPQACLRTSASGANQPRGSDRLVRCRVAALLTQQSRPDTARQPLRSRCSSLVSRPAGLPDLSQTTCPPSRSVTLAFGRRHKRGAQRANPIVTIAMSSATRGRTL